MQGFGHYLVCISYEKSNCVIIMLTFFILRTGGNINDLSISGNAVLLLLMKYNTNGLTVILVYELGHFGYVY